MQRDIPLPIELLGIISSKNKLINADLNGSYNIMRKVVPNVFTNGIEDVVVHPRLVTI